MLLLWLLLLLLLLLLRSRRMVGVLSLLKDTSDGGVRGRVLSLRTEADEEEEEVVVVAAA